MSNRKEEIIMATLELAAQKGLGSVSTNMIAEKVGMKKPSLYNYFTSRDEVVESMYEYLRGKARENSNLGRIDYAMLFQGRTALEVLQLIVANYKKMNQESSISMFYKVIYSERCLEPMAAKIMAEETETMILASKQLFYAMQIHGLLIFQNADMSAVSFAMTVHGLLDYEMDHNSGSDRENAIKNITQYSMDEYLQWFCEQNKISE